MTAQERRRSPITFRDAVLEQALAVRRDKNDESLGAVAKRLLVHYFEILQVELRAAMRAAQFTTDELGRIAYVFHQGGDGDWETQSGLEDLQARLRVMTFAQRAAFQDALERMHPYSVHLDGVDFEAELAKVGL